MQITRKNYELFFIEYLDGTLNEVQISELEDFLLINPDLRIELEGMEKMMLAPEKCIYPHKSLLYKIDTDGKIREENFDDHCIASVEGDLSTEQYADFKLYLDQHPERKKDHELYITVKLNPDNTIIYSGKSELKKKQPVAGRILLYSSLSAAAAIMLILLLLRPYHISEKTGIPLTAKTESPVGDRNETKIIPMIQDSPAPQTYLPENILADTRIINETKRIVQDTRPLPVTSESAPPEEDKELVDFTPTLATLILPPPELERARPDKIERSRNIIVHVEQGVIEQNYLSLSDIAVRYMNNRIFKKEDVPPDNAEITFWDVAQSGIAGINRLTGSSVRLDRQPTDNGDASVVTFDAGVIGFSRTFR